MLYKFKSKAAGDLILLEPQGRQILSILGKEPGPQGIIEPIEMLPAIEALHAAVAREEAAHVQACQDALARAEAPPPRPAIGLRQRVVPFVDMLQRAHAQDVSVVWGV